ncbi:hypothetical protein I4U23_025397 [Adineta vaga]|nr:hypothetical protein I4U23_025397 [Adineta vaga]
MNLLTSGDNQLDPHTKAAVIQSHVEKMVLKKYNNDQKVPTILNEVQSAMLPSIQSQIEQSKQNETQQQEKADNSISHLQRTASDHSTYDTSSPVDKKHHRRMPHNPRNPSHRKEHKNSRQQILNTSSPFTECTDYDPYGNYDKYKAKRLHENKQNIVY